MPVEIADSEQPSRLELGARDALSLLSRPETELIWLVHDAFPAELGRLKRAYSIRSPGADISPTSPSPSQVLYGEHHDEVNRTLVGVLSLRCIFNNQYTAFTKTQPSGVRLSPRSFSWLHTTFTESFATSHLYALVTSMIVNDLGKDPRLAMDVRAVTGEDVSALDHDMILCKAVEAGLVGCLDRLSPEDRADVVGGIRIGSVFNFGQLAQAENTPVCLASLQRVVRDCGGNAFRLRFMEQLLDVAGAAGHMDWSSARKLIEPIALAYRNVYEAAQGVLSGRLSPREGYDLILVRRAELLRGVGFRRLEVADPHDRALMRLLCMGGVADSETARLYQAAWTALATHLRQGLTQTLNTDGSVEEPAVQPTYMPALLAHAANAEEPSQRSHEARQKALQSALRYLFRVMTASDRPPRPRVMVIERSVLRVLKEMVLTDEFRADPDILDTAPLPESVPATTG